MMAAFAFPFLCWWLGVLVWAGIKVSTADYPLTLAPQVLLVESGIALVLFGACAMRAATALVTGTEIANPARWIGVLIAAGALHFHIVFSWIFHLFQHPLFEMLLLRWLSV